MNERSRRSLRLFGVCAVSFVCFVVVRVRSVPQWLQVVAFAVGPVLLVPVVRELWRVQQENKRR